MIPLRPRAYDPRLWAWKGWVFLAIVVAGVSLSLLGCGPAQKKGLDESRDRVHHRSRDGISLVLHDGLSKTGFDHHYTEAEGWPGWLTMLDATLTAQGFTRKREVTVHVFASRGTVINEYFTRYGTQSASGMWQWPGTVQPNLLGFHLGNEVFLNQGPRRQCDGFGAHLVAHVYLPKDDPQHIRLAADWALWDNAFASDAFALLNSRPR